MSDLLHFGQLCGNNYLAQIAHIFAIFVKLSKSSIFIVKLLLGSFYRVLATFYWSICMQVCHANLVDSLNDVF